MARVSDLLDRFRPAAPPGPGSAAAVPAERQASAEGELVAVFAALDEVQRCCATLRATAAAQARQLRADADTRAGALLAAARDEAEALRADAAARLRARADAQSAAITAGARAEADTVRRRAAGRLPTLVARLADRVRAQIGAVP